MKIISEINLYDIDFDEFTDEIVLNDLHYRLIIALAHNMAHPLADTKKVEDLVDTFLEGIRGLGVEDYE